MDASSAYYFANIHRFFTAWIKFARHKRSQRQIVDEKCNRDAQIAAFASLFVERRKLQVADKPTITPDITTSSNHPTVAEPRGSKGHPASKFKPRPVVVRPAISANDPVFQRFQQRAEERQSRQDALRRRREEQHATEQAAKRLEEEQALLAQVEQKKRDAIERKAKLIREKKAREHKLALEAEERIKCGRADEFRNRSLVKYWGVEPWRKLMEIQSRKIILAQEFCNKTRANQVIACWREQTRKTLSAKESAFNAVYLRLLKRIVFDHLVKMKEQKPQDAQLEPARRIFQRLHHRIFVQAWKNLAVTSQIQNHIVNQKCSAVMTRFSKDVYLDRWKKLPMALKHERLKIQYMKTLLSIVKKQIRDFVLPAEYLEDDMYDKRSKVNKISSEVLVLVS